MIFSRTSFPYFVHLLTNPCFPKSIIIIICFLVDPNMLVESPKKKSRISVWYNFRGIQRDILSIIYPTGCCIHDFGEKELTSILGSRILMYCIDFLWLLCTGLVFFGMLMVYCFYFSVSRTHCSVHFPMEAVVVSLLSINDIKTKMDICAKWLLNFLFISRWTEGAWRLIFVIRSNIQLSMSAKQC